jgi:hypothetical protein
MAEALLHFQDPVEAPSGELYKARACGRETPDGLWQGWLEFTPIAGGRLVRSGRETTQPNRRDTEYWAGGLTLVYLQGALKRALEGPVRIVRARIERPAYQKPGASIPYSTVGNRDSALDPFSVYAKSESLLRRQLSALSVWHLVNIALAYDLTDEPVESLRCRRPASLIQLIVSSVGERQRRHQDVLER